MSPALVRCRAVARGALVEAAIRPVGVVVTDVVHDVVAEKRAQLALIPDAGVARQPGNHPP